MKQKPWTVEYPFSELIDRTAVRLVKKENGIDIEYREYTWDEEDSADFNDLIRIHRKIWEKERMITTLLLGGNYHLIGQIYEEMRRMNAERCKIKNMIAERYGEMTDKKEFESAPIENHERAMEAARRGFSL